jgi:alkylation response protein AidB-like acyl-CoA dehydrogenase
MESDSTSDRTALLSRVEQLVPQIQAQAAECDAAAQLPRNAVAQLKDLGVLRATLPVALGGLGFGEGADGAPLLFRMLYLLGQASLAVARIVDCHINALQLILRYGTLAQAERAAVDIWAGHLFALWTADPRDAAGVSITPHGDGYALEGAKAFCVGAGVATRALITARTATGAQLVMVDLAPGERVRSDDEKLGGIRAAVTGSVDFSDLGVPAEALLGAEGDYLREPVFSAGAWRGSAAALGGLGALLDIHRGELIARQRDRDPHQRARFGQAVMAHETARLWVEQAALRACREDGSPVAIVAYVNLARLAVEAACLDAMRLTQRGLGLQAFMAGHPAERLCRDLAVYLRLPAPDEIMDKAAAFYLQGALPGGA